MQEAREMRDCELYDTAKAQLLELTKQQEERRRQLEKLGSEDPNLIGQRSPISPLPNTNTNNSPSAEGIGGPFAHILFPCPGFLRLSFDPLPQDNPYLSHFFFLPPPLV